jgi:hypothetical protein
MHQVDDDGTVEKKKKKKKNKTSSLVERSKMSAVSFVYAKTVCFGLLVISCLLLIGAGVELCGVVWCGVVLVSMECGCFLYIVERKERVLTRFQCCV